MMQYLLFGLKMTEGNITYIYIRYIMDSHHTNKTYQEEYKEQFINMTDEQIEQHIGVERGGNILRCRMTKKLNSLKLLH